MACDGVCTYTNFGGSTGWVKTGGNCNCLCNKPNFLTTVPPLYSGAVVYTYCESVSNNYVFGCDQLRCAWKNLMFSDGKRHWVKINDDCTGNCFCEEPNAVPNSGAFSNEFTVTMDCASPLV